MRGVASAGGGGRKKKGETAMTRTRRADLNVVGGGKGQSSVDGGRQRGGWGLDGMEWKERGFLIKMFKFEIDDERWFI